MKFIYLSMAVLVTVGCAKSTYYIHEGKKQTLTPFKERDVSNQDFYTTEDGVKVGVGDTLLVKFLDTKNLTQYQKDYDLEIVEEILPNLYKFRVKDKNVTLDTANGLSSKDDVKYAHPNFTKSKVKR